MQHCMLSVSLGLSPHKAVRNFALCSLAFALRAAMLSDFESFAGSCSSDSRVAAASKDFLCIPGNKSTNVIKGCWSCPTRHYLIMYSPKSQGACDFSTLPALADLIMESGRGRACLTIAPYSPYSAIILLAPHVFSVFLHLARRF